MNSVAPGPIWTPLIPATLPEKKVANFGDDTPLGRAGQPVELAPVYVLLASDEGSYISGARVAVTGSRPVLLTGDRPVQPLTFWADGVRPRVAGPSSSSPSGAKREPCNGHSQAWSASFHRTTPPRCGHTGKSCVRLRRRCCRRASAKVVH